MYAAVDSSTLISLAWSGQLELLDRVPLRMVIPAAVRRETVEEGLERGYPDAAAIERAIAGLFVTEGAVAATVDAAVLEAGRAQGVLLTTMSHSDAARPISVFGGSGQLIWSCSACEAGALVRSAGSPPCERCAARGVSRRISSTPTSRS